MARGRGHSGRESGQAYLCGESGESGEDFCGFALQLRARRYWRSKAGQRSFRAHSSACHRALCGGEPRRPLDSWARAISAHQCKWNVQSAGANASLLVRTTEGEHKKFSLSCTSRPTRFTASLAPEAPAFHEETPYAPNSPYAASKAASDHLVRAYVHTYGTARR